VGDRIVDTITLSNRRSSHARLARYRRMRSLVRANAFCLAYPTSNPQNHSRTGEKSPCRKLSFGVLRGFSQLWDDHGESGRILKIDESRDGASFGTWAFPFLGS
jgi:hypothetical protein